MNILDRYYRELATEQDHDKALELVNKISEIEIKSETKLLLIFPDYVKNGEIQTELFRIGYDYGEDDEKHYWTKPWIWFDKRETTKEHIEKILAMAKEGTEEELNSFGEVSSPSGILKGYVKKEYGSLYNMFVECEYDGYIVIYGNENDKEGYDTFMNEHYNKFEYLKC